VGEHHRIEGFLGQGGTADVFWRAMTEPINLSSSSA
jgi:hypothetical protein